MALHFLIPKYCSLYMLYVSYFLVFFFFEDFAVVSKIKERAGKKELANDKPKQPVQTVTRGDVMQATRQKCN